MSRMLTGAVAAGGVSILFLLLLWEVLGRLSGIRPIVLPLPSQVLVDLWQFSQTLWPLWMAVAGRAAAPKLVLMWQVAHCVDTETLA